MIANNLELTINFLTSSITNTEKDTEIIITQSVEESTFVDRSPPISIPVNGIETSASCTKNNNRVNEA